MSITSRILTKGGRSRLLETMLQNLLISEVLDPGERFWVISPWIRDIPVIDNRADGFTWVEESWAGKVVSLLMYLRTLCERGCTVTLVRTDFGSDQDQGFQRSVEALKQSLRQQGISDRFQQESAVKLQSEDGLHLKALLGSHFYLHGSMNLTNLGLTVNRESVQVTLHPDPEHAKMLSEFKQNRWGNP